MKKIFLYYLVILTFLFLSFSLRAQLLPEPISGLHTYIPEKTCPGYTIISPITENNKENQKIRLINMEGNVVKTWNYLGMPAKLFPGGYALVKDDLRKGMIQESKTLLEVDWNGNSIWSFDHWFQDTDGIWYSLQHHDLEREGFPTGYYSPNIEPKPLDGHTLVLSWEEVPFPKLTDKKLYDGVIYEVDEKGNLITPDEGGFYWRAVDHFDEFGFDKDAIQSIKNAAKSSEAFDWMHLNTISLLGPNKWYDSGDKRFNPENIIISSRTSNIMAIIDRKTGKFVWKVGPDYSKPPFNKLGQIIGQHHVHMIQKGLPGAGNILLFDNGLAAGYGRLFSNKFLPVVKSNELRLYSRIIEFDPTTYEIKFKYTDPIGLPIPFSGDLHMFFSYYIGSAQRLPNGNTLIDEGAIGRIFEITPSKEIVWEYVSPYLGSFKKSTNDYSGVGYEKTINQPAGGVIVNQLNPVYRAYRVPSKWLKNEKGDMLQDDSGKPLVDYKSNCW